LTAALARLGPAAPWIVYGGRAFVNQPELRNHISGIYIGDYAQDAIAGVTELLFHQRSRT
jgi:hypothetical protein